MTTHNKQCMVRDGIYHLP